MTLYCTGRLRQRRVSESLTYKKEEQSNCISGVSHLVGHFVGFVHFHKESTMFLRHTMRMKRQLVHFEAPRCSQTCYTQKCHRSSIRSRALGYCWSREQLRSGATYCIYGGRLRTGLSAVKCVLKKSQKTEDW